LIASGRAIDLSTISTFGLPSNLLLTLNKNNGFTTAVGIAILAAGIDVADTNQILNKKITPTKEQEKTLYQAFEVIKNQDLNEILVALNCQTPNLESLADLLNPEKLFPNSYETLTVPVYNVSQIIPSAATNQTVPNTNIPSYPPSKIYYPIYGANSITSAISNPTAGNDSFNNITLSGPEYAIYNNRGVNQIANPYDTTSQIMNSSLNPGSLNTYYTGLAAGENIPLPGSSTLIPSTNRIFQQSDKLPENTIKLLIKEAASYYGFDINTISVVSGSRVAPAGLSTAIQTPNGGTIDITDKMVQLAILKGFINANGQSTLPSGSTKIVEQSLMTEKMNLLATEINNKLNGQRPLNAGETFESLIRFAQSMNIPINPAATNPVSLTTNLINNAEQNNSGVSSDNFTGPLAHIRTTRLPPKA
jgi:hypothetical protein